MHQLLAGVWHVFLLRVLSAANIQNYRSTESGMSGMELYVLALSVMT